MSHSLIVQKYPVVVVVILLGVTTGSIEQSSSQSGKRDFLETGLSVTTTNMFIRPLLTPMVLLGLT